MKISKVIKNGYFIWVIVLVILIIYGYWIYSSSIITEGFDTNVCVPANYSNILNKQNYQNFVKSPNFCDMSFNQIINIEYVNPAVLNAKVSELLNLNMKSVYYNPTTSTTSTTNNK
jgi:hypothetical protein